MGRFDGCLLACDIDGTLIYDKLLPERNIRKIEEFVSKGGAFSLSTGRTVQAISDVTEKIKCISPSVLSNGCVIYDFQNNKAISQKLLSNEVLQMAETVINTVGIGVEVHTADKVLVPFRSLMSDLHEQYESMQAQFVSLKEIVQEKINKIIYFIENEKQRDAVHRIAEGYKEVSVFYDTSATINGVKQNYVEQMPKGVSKAAALKDLCRMLKIKNGGYFAIGDYYNDIEMLKSADISAVPCEAPEDVKETASTVVGSAANGAVADFIEYLEEIF
ncbi:MAG: HAD-IIB family hydrolase [Clostridia bacterium]|nr:HAD-IIB family hydrolase [Clostridia bacterium]